MGITIGNQANERRAYDHEPSRSLRPKPCPACRTRFDYIYGKGNHCLFVEYEHPWSGRLAPVTPRDQRSAPLFEALLRYQQSIQVSLHVPGHKRGRAAPAQLLDYLGSPALALDLTEVPGLDDLHAPEGVIRQAQELAAEAYGADRTFFLVGGTTAGLHALILAATRPGTTVAVPRNAHRSVFGALVLSGACPRWVANHYDPELGVAAGLDRRSFSDAMSTSQVAVFVSPTYFGHVDDLSDLINQVHADGKPVLVDEAHGSHFGFHPSLPPSALALGADGVAQSTHKTAGSLTQSSMCHLGKGHRLDDRRVAEMLRLVQSTSPSYLLMASLDLARRELALRGTDLWERVIDLSTKLRRRLDAIPGIRTHQGADPSKLMIDVRRRGLTGFQAKEHLWSRGVAVESADLSFFLIVLTPGDQESELDEFTEAVRELPHGSGCPLAPALPPAPDVVVPPRDAYLGPKETVPVGQALGRVAAELVAPYPPGIPVTAPGERLTKEVLEYLRHAVQAGYRLQGPTDPGLAVIQVIKE